MAAEKKAKATKKAAAPKAKKVVKAKEATASTEKGFSTMSFQGFKISKKRSGRFEVLGKNGKNVNGADKTKVLLDAKLILASLPKAAAAEEAPTA